MKIKGCLPVAKDLINCCSYLLLLYGYASCHNSMDILLLGSYKLKLVDGQNNDTHLSNHVQSYWMIEMTNE